MKEKDRTEDEGDAGDTAAASGAKRARPVSVPKIIHQFWDRVTPPDDVAQRMETWPARHPGWTYVRWSDESAESLIAAHFGAGAARLYRACTIPAMRSDVLRIAAILTMGGVYADADMLCRQSVEPLLKARCTLSHVEDKHHGWEVQSMFYIAEPGFRFFELAWKELIQGIRASGQGRWPKIRRTDLNDINYISGPIMLTRVWHAAPEPVRAWARLIPDEEMRSYAQPTRKLDYRSTEGSWKQQMKKTRIVDFARADTALARQSQSKGG